MLPSKNYGVILARGSNNMELEESRCGSSESTEYSISYQLSEDYYCPWCQTVTQQPLQHRLHIQECLSRSILSCVIPRSFLKNITYKFAEFSFTFIDPVSSDLLHFQWFSSSHFGHRSQQGDSLSRTGESEMRKV